MLLRVSSGLALAGPKQWPHFVEAQQARSQRPLFCWVSSEKSLVGAATSLVLPRGGDREASLKRTLLICTRMPMHSHTSLLLRYRPLALSAGWQAHYALNWTERHLLALTTVPANLTCVRSTVSLQVGAFCVYFVASLKVTPMDAPLPGVWRLRPPLTPCALNTERWNWTEKQNGNKKMKQEHGV